MFSYIQKCIVVAPRKVTSIFSKMMSTSSKEDGERKSAKSVLNPKNVKQEDVTHLSSFASDWWNLEGSMKSLHCLNQIRVPLVQDGLEKTGVIKPGSALTGLKVLDIGCGGGIFAEALSRLNADVTGLDASEELIEVAKAHAASQSLNIEYVCSTIEEYSEQNLEKFDVIVSMEVLEHVPDQRAFLHEAVKCLKVGGNIFVSTLNKTFVGWLAGIIIAENVLNIIPKGTHSWDLFIEPKDVIKYLNEANCTTIQTRGFFYDFLSGTSFFIPCDGLNYAVHAFKRG